MLKKYEVTFFSYRTSSKYHYGLFLYNYCRCICIIILLSEYSVINSGQEIPIPEIPKAIPAPNNVYMEGGIDAMSCVSLEASPVR